MGQGSDDERLTKLEARIDKVRRARAPKPSNRSDKAYNQAEIAWRMVIELVVGLAIGFGIGFGIDAVLDTRPIFLVLMTLFGFAGGVNQMLRTARELGPGARTDTESAGAARDTKASDGRRDEGNDLGDG